jgi:hypothetical protein
MTEKKAEKDEEKTAEPVVVTHERIIATAMNNVKASVKHCQMTGKVSFGKTKYPYANEGDVIEALRQPCIEHGLVIVPSYVSHDVNSKGDVTCVMDVKISHVTGAVWPYEVRAAGTCGQGNVLGAQTSAMRAWYLKAFHMHTGDDPELVTQAVGEGSLPAYVMPNKDIVLKSIMKQHPGASEQARADRLTALNAELVGINADPVDSPDKVSEQSWAKLAEKLKG